jgi:RNA polymerase sigma factor (sigma-70 family)
MQQSGALKSREGDLRRLAVEGKKEEFLEQIPPLLRPLQSYIKRRLRVAYLDQQIRTPVVTSGDILDEVVLKAYEDYARKPEDVSLEQWLYQIANKKIDDYISKRKSTERRRKSLETLSQSELRTLEEMPITADAEGEPWLPEELDDSEYQPRDFSAPADTDNPEQQLERKEELQQILWALARLPDHDVLVFDLYVVEGFSKEEVAKILNIPAEQVPKIAERVKAQVRKELEGQRAERASVKKKAS